MKEDIRISEDGKTVTISETFLEKIKYLMKQNSLFSEEKIDDLKTEFTYSKFSSIIDELIHSSTIAIRHIPDENNKYGLDTEQLQILKAKYLQFVPFKIPTEETSLYFRERNLLDKYERKEKLDEFIEFIDVIYQIEVQTHQFYLMRDLIDAKEDCLINMKYFMNDDEINLFESEYAKAVNEKNTDKMLELLNGIQQLILKEWENFFGDINSMTDDNFKFIGHSTSSSKFNKEFYTKYVSCSLYTNEIHDTYRSRFGFIMGPSNIVGAKSSDMYVNNGAYDEETLLHYSRIRQIDHPQRIIDETIKQKDENRKNGITAKVFSEVIKDGFEPIGIFCFTNGAKGLDWNYKQALELQKSFPNLEVKSFDIMKSKQKRELDEMKLALLNNLRMQTTSFTYDITMKDLARYDFFFEQFEKLKKLDTYTEEDIVSLYQYNLKLLSIFRTSPEELFSGAYRDDEIQYILGKNVTYNIDYILKGEIAGAWALNKLSKLGKYHDKLNHYYEGLGEFVELLSKVQVTDEMVEEIKKNNPLNFYTISKYLANQLMSILNTKEETITTAIEEKKKRYQDLTKEKDVRLEIEKKYQFYSEIKENCFLAVLIKQDFQELNLQIKDNQTEMSQFLSQIKHLQNEVDQLNQSKDDITTSVYQNSNQYHQIQEKIATMIQERDVLNQHPLRNRRKIRNKNKDIQLLSKEQQTNDSNFTHTKQDSIQKIEAKIQLLRTRIQSIEEQIQLHQEKETQLQSEKKKAEEKIYKYFKCHSISEIDDMLKEAEAFLATYDNNNSFYLDQINNELERLYHQIFVQEGDLHNIQTEKKNISRHSA